MPRIIVVGAGSAGCVVAARLSENPANEVVLLESGPDRHAGDVPGLASLNWLDAMAQTDAFHPDVFATRLENDAPRLYHRGRGVGGSGSVNAMLALPGLPSDYATWVDDYGLDQWSWEHVSPWFDRIRPDLVRSSLEAYTPVDRALVAAAEEFDLPADVDTLGPDNGGGALWRTSTAEARHSSMERYLEEARTRVNLTVRADSKVDRLLMLDGRAHGVVLLDQTSLEADEVVLCAGTFETPAILMRTPGIDRDGLGQGLQDHPAASAFLSLRPEFRETQKDGVCIGAVLRLSSSVGNGDVHLLPLHGTFGETNPPHQGIVMAALMNVTAVGRVFLNSENPTGPPVIAERMLSTEHDRIAMRDAIDHLVRALETAPFAEIVEQAFVDADGTPLSALADPDFYEKWLTQSIGDYFHAVGTARMGHVDDPNAVVDQQGRVHGVAGLRVIDASIMPEVPSANTHLPTVMLAERLVAVLADDLASSPSHPTQKENSHVVTSG